jgi:hypothetical protein
MLFSTKAYCTSYCFCRTLYNVCHKTVQDKLNHVIFYKHYTTVAFEFFNNDSLSQNCKLNLSLKHVTLSRLSLLTTVYQYDNRYSYVSTDCHRTVQSYWKFQHDAHKTVLF